MTADEDPDSKFPDSLRSNSGWLVVGLFVAFAVHLIASRDAIAPIVFEDEVGYLMNVRTIVGGGSVVRLGPMGFYSAGWSLALVPLAVLIRDPYTFYQAVLVFVAALGALQIVPLAWLGVRLCGINYRVAIALATIASIYPGRSVMAGYAYSEPFFTMVVLLMAVAIVRWFADRSVMSTLPVGFAAGLLFAIHGRGAATLAATFVVVLVAVWLWRSWRPFAVFLTLIPTVVATEFLHSWLKAELYVLGFSRLESGLSSYTSIRPRAFTASTIGPIWYLSVSSFGLAALGIGVLLVRAARSFKARELVVEQWYLLALGALGMVTIPSFSRTVAKSSKRIDYVIYGRHWDALIPLAIMVGLAAIAVVASRRELWLKLGGMTAFTALSAVLLQVISLPAYREGLPIAALSVAGIAAWIDPAVQAIPILEATAAACAVLLLMAFTPRRAWWLRALIIGVGFTGMAWQAEMSTMRSLDWHWQHVVQLQNVVEDNDITAVSYDLDRLTLYGRNGYAYWLTDDVEFQDFDSSEETPQFDAVIARREWDQAEALGALPLASDGWINETLWILPGPLQDRLLSDEALCVPGEVSESLADRC